MGLLETIRCVASYGWATVFPTKPEEDFASWVSNRFGKRLFEVFFKTYTEKVWGIPCTQIDAEWAAQRIKGLSLTTAVKNALFGQRGKSKEEIVKTLIDEFLYPRHGPGMMWERTHMIVKSMGSRVVFDSPIERICWSKGGVEAVQAGGVAYPAEHFISSIAIRELVESLDPAPPEEVLNAARQLKYREMGYPLDSGNPNILWLGSRGLSVPVGDDRSIRRWVHGDCLLHKAVEEFSPAA